jgi:hypothetical protein
MRGTRIRRLLLAVVLACVLVLAIETSAAVAAKRVRPRPPSCSIVSGSGIFASRERLPSIATAPLDPGVIGTFGLLRRPAGPEDQLPPLNRLGEQLQGRLSSYFPDEIRQVSKDAEGERYFVILGFAQVSPIPPARCLPKKLRPRRPELVARQHQQESEPVYCLENIDRHRGFYESGDCQPFAAISLGGVFIRSAASATDVVDLVPDGVATVRISYRDGEVLSAPVSGNAFSFTPPKAPIKKAKAALVRFGRAHRGSHLSNRQREHLLRVFFALLEREIRALAPTNVQWLGAAGGVLRSFTPSSPEAGPAGFLSLLSLGLLEGLPGEGASGEAVSLSESSSPISTG